ncbi:hypothetical protein [Enterovibrio norvegicus]|nr:hypothetical protein [Enterovibrio norvegicus]
MELIDLFTVLNSMGLSPLVVAVIALLWKQDKRLTIIETLLKGK